MLNNNLLFNEARQGISLDSSPAAVTPKAIRFLILASGHRPETTERIDSLDSGSTLPNSDSKPCVHQIKNPALNQGVSARSWPSTRELGVKHG